MKARQNLLSKFETFIERIVQAPFNFFPSRLEPIELGHKLERAMDENTLLRNDGRIIVPNIYDIYLSIKDHQYLAPNQTVLVRDWQNQMIEYARHRQYILSDTPILRLHPDSSLKLGKTRIVAAPEENGGAGHMSTQALSAEDLAKLMAQFPQQFPQQGQPQQVSPYAAGYAGVPPNYAGGGASNPHMPTVPPMAPQIPQAQLVIRLPQGGQRVYRIEKPVVSIGRQLDNDIIVEDKRVGRYHGQVKFEQNGQFTLYDLGSTNGTTINRIPLMRPQALQPGDVFTIGNYDFQFERR